MEKNDFEKLAAEYPKKAWEQDAELFCEYIRKNCVSDLTDEQIAELIKMDLN